MDAEDTREEAAEPCPHHGRPRAGVRVPRSRLRGHLGWQPGLGCRFGALLPDPKAWDWVGRVAAEGACEALWGWRLSEGDCVLARSLRAQLTGGSWAKPSFQRGRQEGEARAQMYQRRALSPSLSPRSPSLPPGEAAYLVAKQRVQLEGSIQHLRETNLVEFSSPPFSWVKWN